MQYLQGKTVLGLDANTGASICYVGNLVCSLSLIYSIVVVATDKTNKLPRVYAFQSILCLVFGMIIGLIVGIGGEIDGIVDVQLGFPILTMITGLKDSAILKTL